MTSKARCLLAVSIAAFALAAPTFAQDDKGMSEKDCRNVNFPSSEERLVRACNAKLRDVRQSTAGLAADRPGDAGL